jgi:DNA polymerase epsilon subunit 2
VLPLVHSVKIQIGSRSIYGHIDFLGKGATSLVEDVPRLHFLHAQRCEPEPTSQAMFMTQTREDLSALNFFFLSDVWLDHPQTLRGLQKMFDNCVENSFIPKIIVLCGNFTSRSIARGSGRDFLCYEGSSVV